MAQYTKEQKAQWAREGYWRNRERILLRNKTKSMREYKAEWARKYRERNPDKARKKNNEWVRKRREEWLKANGPCKECASWERLEVDHIDPKSKVHHSVWTWSEERRAKELKKCQVLCFLCHRLKTNKERGWKIHGEIMYQKGCRCEECVNIHAKKIRKNRATKVYGLV